MRLPTIKSSTDAKFSPVGAARLKLVIAAVVVKPRNEFAAVGVKLYVAPLLKLIVTFCVANWLAESVWKKLPPTAVTFPDENVNVKTLAGASVPINEPLSYTLLGTVVVVVPVVVVVLAVTV